MTTIPTTHPDYAEFTAIIQRAAAREGVALDNAPVIRAEIEYDNGRPVVTELTTPGLTRTVTL